MVLNVFTLQGWSSEIDVWFGFNSAAWTMTTELIAYIIALLAIWGLRKCDIRKTISAIISVILVYSVAIICCKGTVYERWISDVFPMVRVLDFCIGMLVGRLFSISKRGVKKERNIIIWGGIELLSLVLVTVCMFILEIYNQMPYQGLYIGMFAVMVFIFSHESGFVSTLCKNVFGQCSCIRCTYEFYIFHKVIMTYFHYTNMRNCLGDVGYALFLFVVILCVAMLIRWMTLIYKKSKMRMEIT